MPLHPRDIYPLLLTAAQQAEAATLQEVIIGLTWTLAQVDGLDTSNSYLGLAMSPGQPTRTLPWSGTLSGRSVGAIAPWLLSWDAYEATIAMAALNAVINSRSPLLARAQPLTPQGPANLAVFEHFTPLLQGQNVVIIGRYPQMADYQQTLAAQGSKLTVIERQPGPQDLPDPACEYVLPTADWVFVSATSIVNKTFPRLVELSQAAQVVLMGPTMPWLPELAEMGINYLAGVRVQDQELLRRTVAEGGGVRIFDTAVQYCVLDLS